MIFSFLFNFIIYQIRPNTVTGQKNEGGRDGFKKETHRLNTREDGAGREGGREQGSVQRDTVEEVFRRLGFGEKRMTIGRKTNTPPDRATAGREER